jgi:hypothetical protein
MKRLIIFLSIFLFIEHTQAQKTQAQKQYYLKPVAIDSSVSVSLPQQYTKNNTSGQQSFVANGEYGTMLVIRSANPVNTNEVKNEKGLNNVFKEYVKKVQSSLTKGTIINDHDTIMGKLEVRDFILQIDTGSGLQSRHFRLLYTKNTTYAFEYLYDDFRKDVASGEMEAFFQSIKTAPDLDRDDQYVITNQSDQPAYVNILLFGLIPLAVIIALIIFFRRKTMSLT